MVMRRLWFALYFVSSFFCLSAACAAQSPGPSHQLFSHPYYVCKTNYYVSITGSNANNGTSAATPWRTLQHADSALVLKQDVAGSCINVAPGTYTGIEITRGGDAASSTGYVVYRCTEIDSCTVLGDAGVNGSEAFETQSNLYGVPPNYVMIDGFVMNGQNASSSGVGVSSWNGNSGPAVASHHLWVLNSIIEGFGQSGIGAAASEYYYFIHNRVSGNSNLQCASQGSGIAINVMHSVPNYKPTADDLKNPNDLLGPSWVTGYSFFHNVVEWNDVYNNALTHCGTASKPTNTDGNGIIFDSNLIAHGDTQDYVSRSLVAFNLVYNNGGGGIHLFFSAKVTVANNSCYNNQLDPGNGGTGRACMDDSAGFDDYFINNISVAIPEGYTGSTDCWPVSPPYRKYNFAMLGSPAQLPLDTFSHNITRVIGSSCNGSAQSVFGGDSFVCLNNLNLCSRDPAWTSVGQSSTGTEDTSPVGINFALLPASPAIGYGLQEPYLPAQSVDVGSCSHTVMICN